MTEADFIAKNEVNWKSLEQMSKMKTRADVREFARLFRLASHHLAYAKTHYPMGNALPYLNSIVGVAHNRFYLREKGGFSAVKKYFAVVLPRVVRETRHYSGLAMVFFMLGALFAGFYVAGDTARFAEIMPAGFAAGFTPGETPDFGDGGIPWDGSFMSAFFITNNTAVAFNTFALGIFAGLGSVFILVYNGVIVGGLFGFLHAEGADLLLAYSLILPHGVIELAAIFFAGGGGLMLGKGLLMPGKFTRRHSIAIQARRAALLIPAIVILLVLAAFIEGFFTPLPLRPEYKIAFAAATGIGLVAYFGRRG